MMTVTGRGTLTSRYTAEVWAQGDYAYTSTWGVRGNPGLPGNAVFVWDVRGAPQLVDSVVVPPVVDGTSVRTTGDVQVSDDGKLLVFPTELGPGSLEIYSLADPARPSPLARFTSPNITRGVHTAELQRVGGKLYAFLSVNNGVSHPSRLMVVDLGDPANPREVMFRDMGKPFIHDVYVRDGRLFTALWNDGVVIWDIGGGGKGGTVQNPIEIGRLLTKDGEAHNIWWFHEPATGLKRYAFVGQEGAATLFSSSSGDIHVVDISDPTQPKEVAFFNVPGAGTHNFSVDEGRGILYAAYYNGGVQALDIAGDLSKCGFAARAADGRCDLRLMGRVLATGVAGAGTPVFVWGVHFTGNALYASDMLNGLVKLAPVTR
ncbi:MAG TPA: hypothetical protein PKC83_16610 [Gemmatimonadaceae bacterium]|nr:hypothetical protein [Gemmatimonadaceae bacterium]